MNNWKSVREHTNPYNTMCKHPDMFTSARPSAVGGIDSLDQLICHLLDQLFYYVKMLRKFE